MSFRKALAVLIPAAAFLIGCAGEDGKPYSIPNLSLANGSCLNDLNGQLGRYFDGESSAKEVNALWDCADYAIETYGQYVRGTDPNGAYKATDLRAFLEQFFLNTENALTKRRISDELLEEAMQIKRLFLGGSRLMLTREELSATREIIGQFRWIMLELLPHTQVLFKSHNKALHPGQLDEALKAMDRVLARFFGLIAKQKVRYEFSRLKNLMLAIHEYFLQDDPDSPFDNYALTVPVLAQLKAMLLNSSPNEIAENEWPAAATAFADVVRAAFRGGLSLNERELVTGSGVQQIRATFEDVYGSLIRAFARRGNEPISITEFDNLVAELGRADMLPFGIETAEFSALVGRLLDHILTPQNKFSGSGLTLEKLDYLYEQIRNWGEVQEVIVGVRRAEDAADYPDMASVIDTPWPLGLDSHERLVMDGDKSRPLDLNAQSRLNWSRVAFRLLFQAYAGNESRLKNRQLSRDEIRVAYTDLKPVLVGLNLVEPGDDAFHERLFRDANLFMPRSNADRTLGYFELIEYLHYVFSGISAGDFFLRRIPTECYDLDRIFSPCFRDRFRADAADSLAHMPLFWQQYASRSDDDRWSRDIRNLERINREESDLSLPIAQSDIYESFILLQYVETVMLRFDKNRSGTLDLIEALKAFNHFKGAIGGLLNVSEENLESEREELEALFTYMLKYGELPFEKPISSLRYLNWKWMDRAQWSLSANRGNLLQIIAVIANF